MRWLCGVLGLTVVALCSMALCAEGDWPQWQGPNRDAISSETGLLKEWPKEGPKLAWKATGLGKGFSTISIVGGKFFTMGDLKNEQFVMAFDLASHQRLWATKVGDGWGDGSRCTPTVDGDLVYAIGTHGDLVCVSAQTGELRWRKNFGKDFGGRMMSGWGYSESPLVDGDKLVCTPGGNDASIVALDKKTGDTIWKAAVPDCGGAGYSSIVVSQGGGVRQYVQLMGRGIAGVSAKDGKFFWFYRKIANGTANITTPIVKGDYIFCSTGYEAGSALLKLSAAEDGGIKMEQVYFLPAGTLQNHHGGLILVDGHIYGGHGHNAGSPICIEFETGKVAWKHDPIGSGSAAVLYADGNMYYRYESGQMALVEATPEGFKLKGNFDLAVKTGPSWPHPVIARGKLYIRDNDTLLCYDVKAQ